MRTHDTGDYEILYLATPDAYRPGHVIVTEITSYRLNGQPISREELAKDFRVWDEEDLQNGLDAEDGE